MPQWYLARLCRGLLFRDSVRRTTTADVAVRLCLATLLCISSGCATYRFGHASLYRTDIRTVYVPMIKNNTFRRYMGEQLTEAIAKEIETHTPYKVVHSAAGADSILEGTILAENKSVLSEDINDNPRDIELNVSMQFRWTDRAGNSLMQPYMATLPNLDLGVGSSASFVPEAGQSVTTAKLNALKRVASQVVGEMESSW